MPRGKPRRTPAPVKPPHGMTPAQYLFVLTWLRNGFNGTQAYLVAHPGVTVTTARNEAAVTLAKPYVQRYLDETLGARWKAEQMDAEEAAARVARNARANIQQLFDKAGELLPVSEWPEEIACCVRSVRDGPYGKTITLNDSLSAQRTILELTNKLKNPLADSVDALAEAIRSDLERTRGDREKR